MFKELLIFFFLMCGISFKATSAHNYCKKMLKLGNIIDKKVDELLEKESCCTSCTKGSSGKQYSVTYLKCWVCVLMQLRLESILSQCGKYLNNSLTNTSKTRHKAPIFLLQIMLFLVMYTLVNPQQKLGKLKTF